MRGCPYDIIADIMASKNKTKFFLFITLALLMAGVSVVSYWFFIKPSKKSNSVSEATKKQAEQKDVELAKSDNNKNSQVPENEKQQAPAQPTSVAVNITSLGQTGQTIYINSLVNGTTSGTCSLTMQNGSAVITKSTNIGLQVSYYICQGFSIASSEFVPKGDWTALIEVTTPNGTAKSESRKVTIK